MIRLPVWSTYLEVLNNSTFVREFVLRNDTKGSDRRGTTSITQKRTNICSRNRIMLMSAHQAARDNRFATAIEAYIRVSAMPILQSQESHSPAYRPTVADALNGLAWLQATCPEPSYRELEPGGCPCAARGRNATERGKLLEHARSSLLSRRRSWKLAKDALVPVDGAPLRRRQLRLVLPGDGRAQAWYRDQALEWYDKAVGWFHSSAPHDHELYRFHVEAAQELGFPEAPSSVLAIYPTRDDRRPFPPACHPYQVGRVQGVRRFRCRGRRPREWIASTQILHAGHSALPGFTVQVDGTRNHEHTPRSIGRAWTARLTGRPNLQPSRTWIVMRQAVTTMIVGFFWALPRSPAAEQVEGRTPPGSIAQARAADRGQGLRVGDDRPGRLAARGPSRG